MRRIELGRGGQPLRIAYGRIFHEANAFSPLRTERADFERLHHLEGEALAQACTLRGVELMSFMPHAELTGFVQAARLAGGVETVPLTSSLAVPSGPLTRECFDSILDGLIGRLSQAGKLDGVYLALHGSMQVDDLPEAPEAAILRRVREVVGGGVKVAASYDLHANLSPGMVGATDIMQAYRTNPHWDLAPTGFRAGNRLIRALRGQVRPVHAWRKLPMVLGGGITIDFFAPMRAIFRWMKRIERDPRVLNVSLFMVHPYTAAEDLGWAVHVCTDGDQALAESLATELADRAWAERKAALPPMRQVDEALDEVRSSLWRRLGPVTLVDVDDIVGAGAPGGNTHFVQALVRDDRGLRAFVPVHDPALVDEAWDAPNRGAPLARALGHARLRPARGVTRRDHRSARRDRVRPHVAPRRGLVPRGGDRAASAADPPAFLGGPGTLGARRRPDRAEELLPLPDVLRHNVVPAPAGRQRRGDQPRARAHAQLPRADFPGVDVADWREHDPELRRGGFATGSKNAARATAAGG